MSASRDGPDLEPSAPGIRVGRTTPSPRSPRHRGGAASASCAFPARHCRAHRRGAARPGAGAARGRAAPLPATRPASRSTQGLALFFPRPHSFTGEDVLELHGHGGPVVHGPAAAPRARARRARRRARRVHAARVPQRQARPRAGRGGRRPDRQRLRAGGAGRVALAAGRVLGAGARPRRVACSSCACGSRPRSTFPRRRSTSSATARSATRLDFIRAALRRARRDRAPGRAAARRADGRDRRPPNAGKSSLLNRLAGYDAAIVTPIPGTTRDVLRERIEIDGLPLHVLDTAGLRESPDEVEAEGIRRAHREIARADRVLFVVDAADPQAVAGDRRRPAALPTDAPRTLVFNKIDRSRRCTRGSTLAGSAATRLPERRDGAGPRPAAPAPQGLRRVPSGRRRGALGPSPAPRRAAPRPRARRGGASAAHRASRRRTGGAGAHATPTEAARRDHRRGHERRPARADLRELLHRQVGPALRPPLSSGYMRNRPLHPVFLP